MDDHPIVQAGDGIAAGADTERRDDRVDEAGQRREEERNPESERVALVLQIRLPDRVRVLEK